MDSAGQNSSARRVVVVGGTANQLQLNSTTVRLGALAIASIVPLRPTSESLTLAHDVAKPKVGQVLLAGRGKLVPAGLIAVVRTVTSSSSLDHRPAGTGLPEVVSYLQQSRPAGIAAAPIEEAVTIHQARAQARPAAFADSDGNSLRSRPLTSRLERKWSKRAELDNLYTCALPQRDH
ncbi:hypothetical protein EAS64_20000 [Trebonia kvetii]|uniref:Uncharacterized protein n=1 Tax=Trebonia kvetii TaxID=2480626 RepID=A0A6P2BUK9_9ACTN|nr:hypothetical protein EAS64_20000 [Trebonia kvetii]